MSDAAMVTQSTLDREAELDALESHGGSKQIAVWIDPILPLSDYRGSAIITANTGSSIACMVGSSKGDPKPGDWTTQYNGIPMTIYP